MFCDMRIIMSNSELSVFVNYEYLPIHSIATKNIYFDAFRIYIKSSSRILTKSILDLYFRLVQLTGLGREIIYGGERLQVSSNILIFFYLLSYNFILRACSVKWRSTSRLINAIRDRLPFVPFISLV